MAGERKARGAYFSGARDALEQHMRTTEEGDDAWSAATCSVADSSLGAPMTGGFECPP